MQPSWWLAGEVGAQAAGPGGAAGELTPVVGEPKPVVGEPTAVEDVPKPGVDELKAEMGVPKPDSPPGHQAAKGHEGAPGASTGGADGQGQRWGEAGDVMVVCVGTASGKDGEVEELGEHRRLSEVGGELGAELAGEATGARKAPLWQHRPGSLENKGWRQL